MNLPPHVQELPAYVPGESVASLAHRLGRPPEAILKLDANENCYGTPPTVYSKLAALKDYHHYPDPAQRELRTVLSAYTGVPAEYLLAGNGSDDLLSLMAQVLLEPGERILVCPPTFSMYAFYARLKNCEVITVPRRADFSLDVDAVLSTARESAPKMIFIDSPGNPSATGLAPGQLEELLSLPALVVLDEAYIEFSTMTSQMAAVRDLQNLVVLRTFSKWAGLAGFRVGYGAFPEWLGDVLWKAKSPYNVSTPAMVAAVAALDAAYQLQETIDRIVADRDRLAVSLGKFAGLRVYPSETNFLLVRVEPEFGKSAAEVCTALKENGILIRLFEDLDCLRITVGKTNELETLIQALGEL